MPLLELFKVSPKTHQEAQLLVYMLVSRARVGLNATQQHPHKRHWPQLLLNEMVSSIKT